MVSVTNESPVARLSWLRIQKTAKSKSPRLEILQKLSRFFLLFLSFSYTSYVREKRWTFFVVSLAVRNWPLKNHLFPFPWNCTVLCIFKLIILSRCTTVLASIWFKSHHLKNTLKHFCSCFFLLLKKGTILTHLWTWKEWCRLPSNGKRDMPSSLPSPLKQKRGGVRSRLYKNESLPQRFSSKLRF